MQTIRFLIITLLSFLFINSAFSENTWDDVNDLSKFNIIEKPPVFWKVINFESWNTISDQWFLTPTAACSAFKAVAAPTFFRTGHTNSSIVSFEIALNSDQLSGFCKLKRSSQYKNPDGSYTNPTFDFINYSFNVRVNNNTCPADTVVNHSFIQWGHNLVSNSICFDSCAASVNNPPSIATQGYLHDDAGTYRRKATIQSGTSTFSGDWCELIPQSPPDDEPEPDCPDAEKNNNGGQCQTPDDNGDKCNERDKVNGKCPADPNATDPAGSGNCPDDQKVNGKCPADCKASEKVDGKCPAAGEPCTAEQAKNNQCVNNENGGGCTPTDQAAGKCSTKGTATPSNCKSKSPPACTGDALQCGLIRQQWLSTCDLYNLLSDVPDKFKNKFESIGDQNTQSPEITNQQNDTQSKLQQLTNALTIQSSSQCPSDFNISVLGASIELPISYLCPLFQLIKILLHLAIYVYCTRIMTNAVFNS